MPDLTFSPRDSFATNLKKFAEYLESVDPEYAAVLIAELGAMSQADSSESKEAIRERIKEAVTGIIAANRSPIQETVAPKEEDGILSIED